MSLLIEVLITPAASQKHYQGPICISLCQVVGLRVLCLQSSSNCPISLGFFTYRFSCATTSQLVKKSQKNPASSPVQNQNKYLLLAICILPKFAAHGLVHPIPSPGHQQGIEEGWALTYVSGDAQSCDMRFCHFRVTAFEMQTCLAKSFPSPRACVCVLLDWQCGL